MPCLLQKRAAAAEKRRNRTAFCRLLACAHHPGADESKRRAFFRAVKMRFVRHFPVTKTKRTTDWFRREEWVVPRKSRGFFVPLQVSDFGKKGLFFYLQKQRNFIPATVWKGDFSRHVQKSAYGHELCRPRAGSARILETESHL